MFTKLTTIEHCQAWLFVFTAHYRPFHFKLQRYICNSLVELWYSQYTHMYQSFNQYISNLVSPAVQFKYHQFRNPSKHSGNTVGNWIPLYQLSLPIMHTYSFFFFFKVILALAETYSLVLFVSVHLFYTQCHINSNYYPLLNSLFWS